jgi:hypothetical protein
MDSIPAYAKNRRISWFLQALVKVGPGRLKLPRYFFLQGLALRQEADEAFARAPLLPSSR